MAAIIGLGVSQVPTNGMLGGMAYQDPASVAITNLAVGLGTVGNPSLDFIGDTDTGIFSPGENQIAVGTGGTESIRVISNGYVGIGTTNPNRRFVVSGNNGTSQFNSVISVQTTNTTGFGAYVGLNATSITGGRDWRILSSGTSDAAGAGPLSIFDVTAGLTRLSIDSSGLVGIGTTLATNTLDVNSNSIRLRTARTPASSGATGNPGEICWDANYIYVCVATNTWKRVGISTW